MRQFAAPSGMPRCHSERWLSSAPPAKALPTQRLQHRELDTSLWIADALRDRVGNHRAMLESYENAFA
jgi:hypothetical protein